MLSLYFNLSFGVYFSAMVLYMAGIFSKHRALPAAARFFMITGVSSLSYYIGMRWKMAGRPPFSNMFESLVVFSWAIAAASIFVDIRYRNRNVAAFTALMSLLAIGYASLLDKEIIPLLPALKSNWLTTHVITCFIGYAALTAAFVAG